MAASHRVAGYAVVFVSLLGALMFLAGPVAVPAVSDDVIELTVCTLENNPSTYDGKKVGLSGAVQEYQESKDGSASFNLADNNCSVIVTSERRLGLSNGDRVRVVGTFECGFMGCSVGEESVNKVQ